MFLLLTFNRLIPAGSYANVFNIRRDTFRIKLNIKIELFRKKFYCRCSTVLWIYLCFDVLLFIAIHKKYIFFDLISLVDDRIQPLAMTVKRWAKARSINDASQGTLSSYSLMLMVLHFLQSTKQYWNRIMDPFVMR